MSLREIKKVGESDLLGWPAILQETHSCDMCGAEWSLRYTTDYSVDTMTEIAYKLIKSRGELCQKCGGKKQIGALQPRLFDLAEVG